MSLYFYQKSYVVSQLINTALIPALVEVTGQDVQEADKLILFDVDADGREVEMIASYCGDGGLS